MVDVLRFDTTSLDTIEDSSSVGAYVRSDRSGALITHHALFHSPPSPFSFVDADVSVANDTIAETGHNFRTGDKVQLTTTGVLPAGLALLTDYYVIRVDANFIKLAISAYNAEWGIPVNITAAAGGGIHTVTGITRDVRALDVFANLADGEGNKITSTGNALDVNIQSSDITIDCQLEGVYNGATNTNPDNTGIIVHTRTGAPGDVEQTKRTTGAQASSDNVSPTDVHGLDVNSFNMIWDGSAWDRMTGTGGVLDVSDTALANSAIVSNTNTLDVADTAEVAVASPLALRKYLFLYNFANQKIYVGGSGVTNANGFPVSPGSYLELRAGVSSAVYYVGSALHQPEIRTLELS